MRATLFTVYRVAGTSMLDALSDGDRIVVFDMPWAIDAGDAMVLAVDGEVLVKRVVAEPGDRIAMFAGNLIRNGRVVLESIPPRYQRIEYLSEHVLGADEYFVLGDHRRVSIDSRDFGPVHAEQFLGHVMLRLTSTSVSAIDTVLR